MLNYFINIKPIPGLKCTFKAESALSQILYLVVCLIIVRGGVVFGQYTMAKGCSLPVYSLSRGILAIYASLEWVESLTWSSCLGWRPPWVVPWRRSLWAILGLVSGWLVGGWRYPSSGVGAVLWQSGWGYILPVWPNLGVSSDGATVSPDPSCLSLQYLCCSSLCVGGLRSVCYIWSISPVLSGVLCEFKYALSNSFFLSLSLRTWALGPCPRTTWHDDSLLSPVHLVVLLLQFQRFCLRLWNHDLLFSPL